MFCNFANLSSIAGDGTAEPGVEEYGFISAFHCGWDYIHRGAYMAWVMGMLPEVDTSE